MNKRHSKKESHSFKKKRKIEKNLDIYINLYPEIRRRNPEIRALEREFFLHDDDAHYEKLIQREREIFGDIFPFFPFPVQNLTQYETREHKIKEHELILCIDLRYTKEEIEYKVKQHIDEVYADHHKKAVSKFKKKSPLKWERYLKVYDLRKGRTTWSIWAPDHIPVKESACQLDDDLFYTFNPRSIEEIAKYLYKDKIDPLKPETLKKAQDKVMKDMTRARVLISGHDPSKLTDKEIIQAPSESEDPKEWNTYLDKILPCKTHTTFVR